MKAYPMSCRGWFNYYVMLFNKTGTETSAQLAMSCMFEALRDGEEWCNELA